MVWASFSLSEWKFTDTQVEEARMIHVVIKVLEPETSVQSHVSLNIEMVTYMNI